MARWQPRIQALLEAHPTATEDEIGWKAVEEMSIEAAKLLEPTFEAHRGRNGRLSIQTDPRLFRDTEAILRQAVQFNALAPNMIVEIAATSAGLPAIEEATYRGISVNATVSFTLPQALAVGEAVERGLRRREGDGKDVSTMGPVCTIMVGRLDDWLKVVMDRDISTDPGYLEWAGVAVLKKAYRILRSAGTALGSCPPRSAITCTGASSSAATSSSLRPGRGSSGSPPATSRSSRVSTRRSSPALSRICFAAFRISAARSLKTA